MRVASWVIAGFCYGVNEIFCMLRIVDLLPARLLDPWWWNL